MKQNNIIDFMGNNYEPNLNMKYGPVSPNLNEILNYIQDLANLTDFQKNNYVQKQKSNSDLKFKFS